jgi:rhamnosyltransferase
LTTGPNLFEAFNDLSINIRKSHDFSRSMNSMATRTGLIIPTLNAERHLVPLIGAIKTLSPAPDEILIVDSFSDDATRDLAHDAGFRVHRIPRSEFGHGSARNLGAALIPDADFLLFMTQDALPASPDLIAELVRPFGDPLVAQVFARQLPCEDAHTAARFARLFNYPSDSYRRTRADLRIYGARAVFASNSCAAYRRTAFEAVGGFPTDLPAGEDMAIAGRFLEAGYALCYCARALVVHSHNYSLAEEFRRYFDIGTLHTVDPWFREQRAFLRRRDGDAYVRAELAYTWANGTPRDLALMGMRQLSKWLGYQSGRHALRLPTWLNRRLSLQSYYWK